MNLKQVIKIVVFLAIFGVIIYFMCDIFEYKNNYMTKGYTSYKNCEEGLVDAVFIGTSAVNRSWIACKGFDMYGMTVMTLSIDALPCWLTLDMIKEAYRFNDPKLVILDMRMFTIYEPEKVPDLSVTRSRRAIDTLDFFSPYRLDMINRTLELVSGFEDYDMSRFDPSLFFSFMQYHGMWADDDFAPFEEIGSEPAKYLGFYVNGVKSIRIKKQSWPVWSKGTQELTQVAIDNLNEIIDYSKEKGFELLFVDTPYIMKKVESKRHNELCRILDEKGIKYVSYSDEEWFIDPKSDDAELARYRFNIKKHFYDSSHLNFDGAVIFTRLFAKYLDQNYDFPDHRGDERLPEWNGKYDKLKDKMKSLKKKHDAKIAAEDEDESDGDREDKEREEAIEAMEAAGVE